MVLVTTLATAGCDRDRSGALNPSRPTSTEPATMISQAARAYLDATLAIMEAQSVNKGTIDWASFRSEVFAAAVVAQAIPDTYPAIAVALRLLNDHESYYVARDGRQIGPSPVGGCSAATPAAMRLPDTIGYVKVDSCPCDGNAATTQFAESIQRALRDADRAGLAGWIVDLRGNLGGNMWPMIAGVGPLLGEGIIGYIVYNDRDYEREYRDGAALSLGEVFAHAEAPYALLKPQPRVAVLTDGTVASAGEAIVVFFKGRPETQSFGTPTCGHHHLTQGFRATDGASLFVVTAQSADRMKRKYGGPIEPDQIVSDPGQAVDRAVAWLQGRN